VKSPYTSQYFTNNRRRLIKAVKSDTPIVLTANSQLQYSADTAFPFRQDTNFWYMTGVDEPGVLYVFDGEKETLVLPKQNIVKDVFDGAISVDAIKQVSGIERVISYKQGNQLLRNLLKKHHHIATLLPATALRSRYGIMPNPARHQLTRRLRRYKAGITFKHLGLEFAHLRMIKSAEEILALQASIDLTIEAFNKVKSLVAQQCGEHELDACITSHFLSSSALHAYPAIIAGGERACTLHYTENNQVLEANSQVLIDAGAERFRGAADISRTYAVGAPSGRLRAVHTAVLEVQNYAISLLLPGVTLRDYEKKVEVRMGEVLKELGLITRASRKQIRKYFPHASSHFLGLDVHDAGDYELPLAKDMVLTVEPGIYIPEESIGVRIEDNLLITETGAKVLSAALPRDLC
jgi:Xaa-Pro aminopeptidase